MRTPGHIAPGTIATELFSGQDWFRTLLAAAGDTDTKECLLKGGTRIGNKTFKGHVDGYNQLPYLTGQTKRSARGDFYYFNDDSELVAVRYDVLEPGATKTTAWKVVFCEQRAPGQLDIWRNPFTCLRVPRIFNLRKDPYEHAQISGDQYDRWNGQNLFVIFEGVRRSGSISANVRRISSRYPCSGTEVWPMFQAIHRSGVLHIADAQPPSFEFRL